MHLPRWHRGQIFSLLNDAFFVGVIFLVVYSLERAREYQRSRTCCLNDKSVTPVFSFFRAARNHSADCVLGNFGWDNRISCIKQSFITRDKANVVLRTTISV